MIEAIKNIYQIRGEWGVLIFILPFIFAVLLFIHAVCEIIDHFRKK